jgi:hypothetical protein
VDPLLISLIFVVTMALPAVVAVRYAAKPKRELALGSGSARRRQPTVEGSVALPARVPKYFSATPGPWLLDSATLINQLPVGGSFRQLVDEARISREDRESVMA